MTDYLEWDSRFFNQEIYRVNIQANSMKPSMLEGVMTVLAESAADGAYVVLDKEHKKWEEAIEQRGGVCADRKVLFVKNLDSVIPNQRSGEIEIYQGGLDEKMFELAYLAGTFSRFKTDLRLRSKFNDMYRTWMTNSILGKIADLVLVHKSSDTITGMITGKADGEKAVIGLIATDPTDGRKGVGASLMSALEAYYSLQGVKTIEVATQACNAVAMGFYKKCGYQIQSVTPIFHIWLKN